MSSQNNLAQAALPAGILARAAWTRRLWRWRLAGASAQLAGVRLVTPDFVRTLLARQGNLPATVVKRGMGIWSSCALDWQVLTPRLAARCGPGSSAQGQRGHAPQARLPGSRTVPHWHSVTASTAVPGVMPYGNRQVQTLLLPVPAAARLPDAVSGTGSGVASGALATSVPMLMPAQDADKKLPAPHDRDGGAMLPTSGPPGSPSAVPTQVAVLQVPVALAASVPMLMSDQNAHKTILLPAIAEMALAPHGSGGGAMLPTSGPPGSPSAVPTQAAVLPVPVALATSVPMLMPDQNAHKTTQLPAIAEMALAPHGSGGAMPPTSGLPGNSSAVPTQAAAPASWPTSFIAPTAPLDRATQTLGDLLYDQAMRNLPAAVVTAATALPMPRLDVLHSSLAPTATAPSMEAAGPAPVRAANGKAADTAVQATAQQPYDNIEQLAQRVKRILQREQRREREAKGVI